MSDVNDDMDELFKRAAENYPLNTDSSDWNEVQKKLQPLNVPLNNVGNKRKFRNLLWLLLLVPLTVALVVLNKYIFNPVQQNTVEQGLSKKYNTSQSIPGKRDKENLNKVTPQKSLTKKNNVVSLSNNISKVPVQTFSSVVNANITKEKYSLGRSLKTVAENNDAENLNDNTGNEIKKKDAEINKSANTNIHEADVSQATTAITDTANDKPENHESVKNNLETKPSTKEQQANVIRGTDSLKHKNVSRANTQKGGQRYFYAGIIAGPDFTTVKLQKFIKTGYTGGIITGYRFNKKWSIETGFYLDKKYYYTEGKYFSTTKIPIPYTTKIVNADGYCNMIELPVNIKYDFLSTKKTNWFALAGSSSYLMKRENYSYRLDNSGWLSEKNYSYKNSSKNWASIINLSVGYSRNVGKNGILRIEPYIKIPVSGVGIGSLPITSSGVYFGFTKKLF